MSNSILAKGIFSWYNTEMGRKIFFIFLLFIQCVFCQGRDFINYKCDKFTAELREKGRIKRLILEGNVKIIYGDTRIRCEKAIFDVENGDIEAEGNVEVKSKFGKIECKEIYYNLYKKDGFFSEGDFSLPPFYGRVKRIEKKKEIFILEDGYFTTCDLKPPHYRVMCKRIEYSPENYLKGEKIKIIFGEKFTLFYLPRFTISLKEKKSPFHFIPGYKTHFGKFLTFIFTHPLNKKSKFISSENIKIGTKGMGAGLEIYSLENFPKTDSKFFTLKKWEEKKPEKGSVFEFKDIRENKFGNIDFIIDWRWMENKDFFYHYFKSDYYRKYKMYNNFSISQNFGNNILNFLVRENAGEDFLKIEKLPELRFYIPYCRIKNSPVFLSSNFQITSFNKEEKFLRIMENIKFETKKNFRYFTLKPWISLSAVDYKDKDCENFNFVKEIGINTSFLLYKFSPSGRQDYIIPSISFTLRNQNYRKEELPYFDINEEFGSGKFIGFKIKWNLWKDKDYSGEIGLDNFYDIGRNTFSDSLFKYKINFNKCTLTGENLINFSKNGLIYGINDFGLEIGKFKYEIGTRYLKDEIWGLENWFEHRIGENWKYRIGIYYDFKNNIFLKESLEIWKRLHCLMLNLSIAKERKEFSFYISLIPTAFLEKEKWERRFLKW